MVDLVQVTQQGYVRRLTFNRPAKLNAFTPEMEVGLDVALEDAVASDDVRVVVLSGAGRAFSTGFDTSLIGEDASAVLADPAQDVALNQRRVERWLRIRDLPLPTIAQVHGYCLGMANEIVGACDLVVCSRSARFGMPEVREFALPPTLAFWPARIGLARTKELLFTGRLVTGDEAARIGLANDVVDDEELKGDVDKLAESIAEASSDRITMVKVAVNAWGEAAGTLAAARAGATYHALYHQISDGALRDNPVEGIG